MYGFNPKAIIEKFAKVPPEKTSKRERRGLPKNKACRLVLSTPEAGMWAISLKTTKIEAVIIIFLLMSGDLNALEKNWAIWLNIELD